jgi:outer membrane protein insertion porin family
MGQSNRGHDSEMLCPTPVGSWKQFRRVRFFREIFKERTIHEVTRTNTKTASLCASSCDFVDRCFGSGVSRAVKSLGSLANPIATLFLFTLRLIYCLALAVMLFACAHSSVAARESGLAEYEGRLITSIEVTFEGSPPDAAAQADFLALLKVTPNSELSMVGIRDSLQALFDSGRVANARVEVIDGTATSSGPIRLRFVLKRQVQISEIKIERTPPIGTQISADQIRARLNLVQPGTRLSNQITARNADEIQVYLRDRGYFNATVEHTEQLDSSGTRATVTYRIVLGEQARVGVFNSNIPGADLTGVKPRLRLQPGAAFTREALGEDMKTIRQALIDRRYLAPSLEEPRVERDAEQNLINIYLTGTLGPKVNVEVKEYELSEKKKRELLPVLREGNIDPSAIVEGARRIRNRLQEDGYFFAEVTPVCSVNPPLAGLTQNGAQETCDLLNPEELSGRTVDIVYEIERGRRFRLTDIRITGTNKLTYDDVAADLKTQKASALGLISFFRYGRGYTSLGLLEQDKRTIRNYIRDLGFRHAEVEVLQGVSLNGENLIITFNVAEGPLTRVAGVEVRGNKIYIEDRLLTALGTVVGAPFSLSQARRDGDRMLGLYARGGYINPQMDFSIVELPKKGDDEQVRLIYWLKSEGDKVLINNIIVNGVTVSADVQRKKRDAIVRASLMRQGDVLRADRISDAERELYLTDAYRQVIIHTESAGETASGFKKRDVIIDVEEKKPRVMDYGGGYSTDTGPLGLLEISNVNLQNKLRHGAMRLRISSLQQLIRFEYLDPRFARYGTRQFAPLALSVEYQRDSTVTRFFRSAIDRGTMGIVQRLDEDGNPIDEFGNAVDDPTINRFTVRVETQRVLDRRSRTIVFANYTYEDVRLFNLQSLLLKPILQPDRAVRITRFGGSLVRDTRQRCERGLLPARALADEGEGGRPGEVCRYNQFDATRGAFFSVDYALALRQLGGNISFNRLQANYRRYYKLNGFRGTVLAGNATLGLANIFNPRDRDDNGTIDEIDFTLPISERFFSGGATTLRGFRYEEAGPRQVIIPEGEFRDQNGELVFLNPFTVPVGGNAVAVVNLEARVPLTRSLQVVPFYDGGNVYRRVGDLFGKSDPVPPAATLMDAINAANLRAKWSNTVGLGFRIQTPFGGALAVDYGFLLNPPEFLIPQRGPAGDFNAPPAVYRLGQGQLHFKLSQTF